MRVRCPTVRARARIRAARIVIAAPTDASFPSLMKGLVEHICVNGVTFAYGEAAARSALPRVAADVYHDGGWVPGRTRASAVLRGAVRLFCIEDVRFFCRRGLDAVPEAGGSDLAATLESCVPPMSGFHPNRAKCRLRFRRKYVC